jgi:predicted dehydrogenase
MKQVTQNYKTGNIELAEVEPPALKPGGVLVRSEYSVISTGTEGMKVREGKLSYLGKARARPDQLKKVVNTARQQGLVATYLKVMNKLDSLTPLGYSLAGEVIGVGSGAEEFHVGQRVACAGAGYANHAEINFIPKNLVVPVPDGVASKHAAFSTVGAIALQGFRQAEMQLGETACVIGLGLLGQFLVQILRAAGMHVVGVDLVESRCGLAAQLGAKAAITPGDARLESLIGRMTGGYGVDCVFIATGGASNAATELAVNVARDRARVVDIGKTRLDLPWNDYYRKELDLRFSRSYGPGRYDPLYEEGGIDYPIGYVRWTEKRNLASFLELVVEGKVLVDPIISAVHSFCDAERIYQEIEDSGRDMLGVVFQYERPEKAAVQSLQARAAPEPRTNSSGCLRLALIGAGNYASSMLLPHLQKNGDVELVAVATMTGLSGQNAKRKFGFRYATTEYREILDDPGIDAVLIATRHASHARLVSAALRAGKTTYVEKPLAISLDDVGLIRSTIIESSNDRLMVGFNRRFSPVIREIRKRFRSEHIPTAVHYRVHAGRLEQGSWYLDPAEGSRFVGEAGHFFDTLAFLADSRPVAVTAMALRPQRNTADDLENIAAIVRYENGSVGNLLYLTQGGAKVPKEFVEVFGGGMTAQLHNFESFDLFHDTGHERSRVMRVDKGQKGELEAFVGAARATAPMPIPIDDLFDTTLTTLAVMKSIRVGKEVMLSDYLAVSAEASN